MRQQSFRHRGSRGSSGIAGSILLIAAVVIGAFLVYQLILWFRSSNEKTIAEKTAAVTDAAVSTASAAPAAQLNSTAIFKSLDGTTVGTVVRSGTVEVPSYSLVANLPGLAAGVLYEVWLVKDGLADVKSVGALNPRADGSWAETFTMKDPLEYPTVVIMLESDDGNPEPSGNRVVEGRFE